MCTLTSWRRILPPPPEKFGAAASRILVGAGRRTSRIWFGPAGKRTAARLRGLALGGWLVTYRNKCLAPGLNPDTVAHLSTYWD